MSSCAIPAAVTAQVVLGAFVTGALVDERLLRADGTTKIQSSPVALTDAGAMSGLTQLTCDNLRLDGNTLSSQDTNGNIVLSPNGTGVVSAVKKMTIDTGTGTLPALIVSTTALQIGGADALGVGIQGDAFSGTGLSLYGRAASGTRASPTATNGQILINLLGYGHNGTALTTSPAARYQIICPTAWDGSSNETAHVWSGTPSGSTTAAEWMRLVGAGLAIGSTALVGSERLRVAGGTIATPGSTDVCIAAGIVAAGTEYRVGATKVVESRKTGWGAPTGAATRTTFDTATVTLPQLAERVKALIDDLTTHGLIGT